MPYAFATILIISQFLLPGVVDEVVFVPTVYDQQEQVEVIMEPVGVPQLPLSKDKYPTRVNQDALGPNINAKSAIVIDYKTGLPLWQKNPELVLPIASLTKLMTALVLLDLGLDWSQEVEINADDNSIEGARLKVPTGVKVTLEDVFRAMLVGSANNATQTLVSATGLGEAAFVEKMNQKAFDLGLENTVFVEPTGLSENNVSTVVDYVKIAKEAFSKEKVRSLSVLQEHLMETTDGQFIQVKNTNKLVRESYLNIAGSKTGFTYEAGYCLVMLLQNQAGDQIISLVLNSETDIIRQNDSKAIEAWTFGNYQWPK